MSVERLGETAAFRRVIPDEKRVIPEVMARIEAMKATRAERAAREELYQAGLTLLRLTHTDSPIPHNPVVRQAAADLWATLQRVEAAGRF